MKTRKHWLGCFFLGSALVLGAGIARDARAENDPALETRIDTYLKPYLELKGFNGAVLIARGGKILLRKGYGMANYELDIPNTPRTKFHIASISKPFTAAAIMLLVERSQLSVRDPLSRFIPDYPNGEKITLHHLLTHTSGVPNVNEFPDYDDKSKFPHTTADLIKLFRDKSLLFEPGQRYSYSNSNYNLLAYIIEKVSGKNYGDFLRENMFDPLEMRDTGHHGDAGQLVPNRATGYAPAGLTDLENAPYIDWSIKTGNGSLYSTVDDLFKWDRALYTERILKKSTLQTIFENEYGWFVGKRFNRRVIRYNGRSPGFGGEIQRYVDDDTCIIVLSNNYAATASIIANDLAAMVFGEPYEITKVVPPHPVDPRVLDGYAGRYQFGPDFFVPNAVYTVSRRGNLLIVSLGTSSFALVPQSETTFFVRMFWSTVRFEKNEAGEVTQLIWQYLRDYPAKRLPAD